jgi:acyl transferase domain-containing protein/NAD(P)-dependent dehydrogenase (short-subunit alcohol dehydrogenase family)
VKHEELDNNIPAEGIALAIIGIGCHFPQAEDSSAYWANIREGIDAITDIPPTHWHVADYYNQNPAAPDMTYGQRGGFLSSIPFNPMEFNIPPATLEAIDTSQLLGLVTAGQALRDAGYGADRNYDRSRVSVILGVTGTLELVIPLGARLGHPHWRAALKDAGVDDTTAADVIQRIADSYVPWQENSFPGLLGNVVAGRISKQYDLGGTNCTVDAACASSFSALHLAGMELATGKSDMVVTGGIDTFNDIFMYMCFSKTPALSASGNAKPFDVNADGTILGEGLGLVVIKRLADAERDNDRIYAVIRGVGSSSDGKGEAIYTPSASGQKKAILDAYQRAGVTPKSIALVEAHGTGTKVGDAVEVSALRDIYGESDRPWCALSSVKSQIGHTKASAGAAGLIKAALALHHKVIPPTIKVEKPLKEVSDGPTPFYITAKKRPWIAVDGAPRRAAVSAFGFGGSNFHTVLEEYRPTGSRADWDGNVQILAFSGTDAATLETALSSVSDDQPWESLRAHAATLRTTFDSQAPCRLTIVVERNKTNLKSQCSNAIAMLCKSPATAWSTPDGAFYSVGAVDGKLGLLFPGQGAQYTGMLRDLACTFPEMQATLADAESGFTPADGTRLTDLIYPASAFGPDGEKQLEEALRATNIAQPAIGAVSLGALRVLESFGIIAEAAAGHSYGELTALCTAGRLDEPSFHALSRLRGQLMAEGKGDKGSMLAVSAPLADVTRLIEEEKLELVIANCNAPTQFVLSGRSDEITRAVAACSARKLTCKQLPVAAAFHSSLVADAAAPLLTALADINFAAGTIPVFSNTTATAYPAKESEAKEVLAGQLAKPVEFVAEIEAMHAAGVKTFVEVGPGARLSGLVKSILGDNTYTVMAVDASGGKRSGVADLARCLAQLAVLGHSVNLVKWDEGYTPPQQAVSKKAAMTIPICGANYVKPKPKRPPSAPVRPAVQSAPTNTSFAAAPLSHDALTESLRVTREGMSVLQKMQEDTAQLHRRFLEGQETASRTIQTLLEQQSRILHGGAPLPTTSFSAPAVVPAMTIPLAVPVAQPVATLSPSAPTLPTASSEKVTETLLAVVSEKTGYPIEMLELEMGLDSDLGIDSIKRVEILSALQERLPGSPVIGPEHLGSLHTLGEIAAYLGAGMATAVTQQTPVANNVTETLLAVVSEKTGYPIEMLELEMGLDSDLGIDSIKRVEILSALQERLPGSPVIGPEHLGSLHTLGEIATYLGAGMATESSATVQSSGANNVTETLLAVVSEKTGYPVEMLELEMGLDSDLGIDSIKRVEILSALQERLPGSPVIGPEHLGSLHTLGEIASFLEQGAAAPLKLANIAPATVVEPEYEPACLLNRSTVIPALLSKSTETFQIANNGIIWITDDGSNFSVELCTILKDQGRSVRLVKVDEELNSLSLDAISGLVIVSPAAGTNDSFLENAFLLLKKAAPSLRRSAGESGAFFTTVSRLDGAFAFDAGSTLVDPLSGGLAGLSKTAAHEWTEVTCKAIDLGAFPDSAAAVKAVADELFLTGPVEIGLKPSGRIVLTMADLPALTNPATAPLQPGDVVVVTGGGRGVTAATAIALAEAYRPTLVLLGRSPEPQPEPAWLSPLTDESAIKMGILQQSPGKLHPKEIEERYHAVIAGRELKATLAAVEAVGGHALYHACDIRNTDTVNNLLQLIRQEQGPIRGIVHGAGVLADRLISDKTREQFASVYGTKVTGLRTLLAATGSDDLRFIALFGSTTGRFGRSGQVDYAVANEVLNKLAQAESRRRPACRTVCINWGPWDGGMVTPALKKVFSGEGIGLISLAAGGELLAREIAATDAPTEVVVLAETAGTAISSQVTTPAKQLAEAFSLSLTVADYPFLRSHVINGKAVLPMAMIVEWLAHGALHGNPGFRFHGFNDLRICKGVTFEQNATCSLHVMAGRAEKRDSLYYVPVELTGVGSEGRSILHARAEIVLATKLPDGIRSIVDLPTTPYPQGSGAIYNQERLFHGADLQGIEQVGGCSPAGISAMVKAAPEPSNWLRQPLRNSWITDPLMIDCAFQLMILWSFERFGSGSLPSFAGRYRQFQESFPIHGTQIAIRVTAEREHGASADMEFLDRNSGKLIARLEGYECVIDPSLQQAFRCNQLSQPGCVAQEAA